ncbi:sulfurtransferase TusA family protein [Paracoccus ravus]|uniref:sulfurtransferase TusA family protein n=1 Tax=Paracoccus ravus TaxID=2447760 RepID=UPI00106E24E8|nr:sulfurtransferase TusA family protein [Paracoccus ravus]
MSQIDARGLLCPLPVLKLRKALIPLAPGAQVQMIATDRAARIDVPHFCAESGHHLLATRDLGPGETEYTVIRGPDA